MIDNNNLLSHHVRNFPCGLSFLVDEQFAIQVLSQSCHDSFNFVESQVVGTLIHDHIDFHTAIIAPGCTHFFSQMPKPRNCNIPIFINSSHYCWSHTAIICEDRPYYLITAMNQQTSQSLPQDDNFFRKIIDNLPQYIFWKDKNSVFLGCNQSFANLVGLNSPAEIVGKSDYNLPWTQDESDSYCQDDEAIIETGIPKLFYEETQRQADGLEHIVLVSKMPLEVNNIVSGILCIYQDITAVKVAELLKMEKLTAERRANYLRTAAGTIAHDLRTPLASIKFALHAIDKIYPDLKATYQNAPTAGSAKNVSSRQLNGVDQAIKRSLREVEFSNSYIDLILDNLKHDEINTVHYQHYEISKVVSQALADYPFQNMEKNLIEITIDPDFLFWGDDIYLKSIMNNLLKNALYYIKKNNKGKIYIRTENQTEYHVLHFLDTAEGASQATCEKMFDDYFSSRPGGIGLGLAFCRSVMESFGGHIHVESTVGEYIQFSLLFPKPD